MYRFIKFLFLLAIGITLITFCVVNRQAISLNLFPLPYAADVPIFLLALACVAVGVIIAGVLLNMQLFAAHRLLKHEKSRATLLEKELSALREQRDITFPTLSAK